MLHLTPCQAARDSVSEHLTRCQVARSAGIQSTRRRILDAALNLITRHGGADVSLADVAQAAHLSRQALYLHLANRSALLIALVRHADERRALPAAIQRVSDAPTGVAAVRAMVALQATMNPKSGRSRACSTPFAVDQAAEQSSAGSAGGPPDRLPQNGSAGSLEREHFDAG